MEETKYALHYESSTFEQCRKSNQRPDKKLKQLTSKEHKITIYISSSDNFWEQITSWSNKTLDDPLEKLDGDLETTKNSKTQPETAPLEININEDSSESAIMETFNRKYAELLLDIENKNLYSCFGSTLMITAEDEAKQHQAWSEDKPIMKWVDSDEHECLSNRTKGKHLSSWQRAHIIKILAKYPEDRHMIKSIYKLSQTLFSNLLRVEQAQSKLDECILFLWVFNQKLPINSRPSLKI